MVHVTADVKVTWFLLELPLTSTVAEFLVTDDETETESETVELHLGTVRVDGDWHVSIAHTIGETYRARTGGSFDLEPVVVPSGSATPDETFQRFLANIEAGDLTDLVAMVAPGEGDALRLYSPLFLPEVAAEWASTPGPDHDVVYDIAVDGDRATVTIESFTSTSTTTHPTYGEGVQTTRYDDRC